MRFPKAVQFKHGDTLSLYSFSMYNSTFNISASQYQNNKIYFTWFNGTTYTFTIPDGYYAVSDLNTWLQSQFILNNLYCTNASGSTNIYFAQFQTNPSRYKNEIDIYYMPSSANALIFGYVKPASATWAFPAVNTLVQLTINNGLLNYFGMSSRVLFGNETIVKNYQYLSDTTPIVSPVFSYLLTTNLICSDMNQVATVFSQFPVSASFGQLIYIQSSMDTRINIKQGLYSEIIVQLWDQTFMPLVFQDPELTLFLIIDIKE
jgi:hypothetical protein